MHGARLCGVSAPRPLVGRKRSFIRCSREFFWVSFLIIFNADNADNSRRLQSGLDIGTATQVTQVSVNQGDFTGQEFCRRNIWQHFLKTEKNFTKLFLGVPKNLKFAPKTQTKFLKIG
jgi:hypothetical protein